MSTRFIYIVGVTENPVKIGIADDMTKRLAQLQCGCPDELIAHHIVPVPHRLASKVEAQAHAAFKDRHRHGEWFNVSASEAHEFVQRISAELRGKLERRARQEGDTIAALAAITPVAVDAQAAVHYYRTLTVTERFLLDRDLRHMVGDLPFSLFNRVIIERQDYPEAVTGDPELMARAHGALAQALNSLSDLWRHRRLAA